MSEVPPHTESIFWEALAIPSAPERAQYLEQACGGDAALRAQLEDLLAAYPKVERFLEAPAAAPAAAPGATVDGPARAEGPGTRVGPYKLLQQVGEGGMGVVYLAEQQEPVRRRVALKIIKPGMDSRQVIARFEAERQALALMDHQNIARVLDAGTTAGGRPYFVMELVKGVPITKFCDEQHLTPRERLELFVPVCQAIQHAHQKGIIHRDLKPSNVLVALYDGRPVPKVIDFGVAKAIEQRLTERTLFTQLGQVVGTLEYMSPEQAELNQLDIDTRSDIYSLGVLLYELLTGTTPLERQRLRSAAFTEMLRMIREEEPPKPSTRLSASGDKLPSISAQRKTEPAKLTRLVRGELDWIVMKALEKDRARRYETANGFARDIERYLADEPVSACPPSAAYRLGKLLRRHKGPVLAAALVFCALLAGMAGTTLGLLGAEARRQEAERARADEAGQRRLAQANEVRAQRAAEAEKQAQGREAAQRAKAEKARDRARQALDAMTSSVTGDSLTTQAAISDEQKTFLTEVLTYYQEFAGEKADDEPSRSRTAQAAYRVGMIEARLGRKAEAAAAFRLARDGYAKLAADFPAVPEYRQELAGSHYELGMLPAGLGKQAEAEQQYREALALYETLAADFPAAPKYRGGLASSHHSLGSVLAGLGKQAEAERQYRKALALFGKLAADCPAVPKYRGGLAGSHHSLGMLLAGLGKHAEAEQQYRQALALYEKLAADCPAVPEYRHGLANSHNSLGIVLASLGKRAEAEKEHRQALALHGKLAADFPAVPEYRQELAGSHNNLGTLLDRLGKQAEAEQQYRQALALFEKLAADCPAFPEYQIHLGGAYCNFGNLTRDGGQPGKSLEWYAKAIRILTAVHDQDRRLVQAKQFLRNSHWGRAQAYDRLRQYAEASRDSDRAIELSPPQEQPGLRAGLAGSHHNLGLLLAGLGKRAEAEKEYRQALALYEKLAADFPAVPEYRHDLASSHNNLGALLAGLGKRAEAEKEYRQALALYEKLAADFPAVPQHQIDLGGACCNHGNLILTGGQPGKSLEWYAKAIRILMAVHDQDRRLVVAKQFLRNSHLARAIAYDRLRQYAEAVRDWDRAIELSPPQEQPGLRASRATARINAGQVAEAVAEVAELTKMADWNAGQWYAFACVYALASGKSPDREQEYADRAMDLLHRAVKAGWTNAAQMAKDTDLDPLRGRADFQKLLAGLEKKAAPTPEKQP
jgi:serine/threonine protein kinase/Flp pilus assembly protein TadD